MILILKMLDRLCLSLIFISALTLSAIAQSSTRAGVETSTVQSVESRRASIEEISRIIEEDPNADYFALREQLRNLRSEANSATAPLRALRDDLQSDLDRLGPKPADDIEEASEISEARIETATQFRMADEAIKQGEINVVRIGRLLEDLANLRRAILYQDLFKRGSSPLSAKSWKPALQSLSDTKASLDTKNKIEETVSTEPERGAFSAIIFLLSILFGLALFSPVRRWIETRVVNQIKLGGPTTTSRTAVACARTFTRVVPGIIGGFIIYETAKALGYITPEWNGIALAIWCGILALFVVDGVSTAVFSPKNNDWRLMPIASSSALTLRILLLLSASLFAIDAVFNEGAKLLGLTSEVTLMQTSAVSLIGSALLFLICRKSLWQRREDQANISETIPRHWPLLRKSGGVIAVLIILATLLGYVALGRFAITRIFFLASLFSFGWLLRALIQEAITYFSNQSLNGRKQGTAKQTPIQKNDEPLLYFWLGIFLDIAILILISPIALLVLGFEWVEVRDWMHDAFFGFQVGSKTISIAQILAALFVFILIMFMTRTIQSGAEKRVFSKAKIDGGVRDSIRTLIGYAGLVIAVMSAVSMLGLNMANFAIIAGALSLGLGFGLQSVVNNFVSGLILLFERPVKVGDWIVVNSGQGIVKRISVRSTEIETFDRSSIIVPNSELISSAVTNWTHSDKNTRIVIPVGVSYNEDPQRIIDLLTDIMNKNKRVMLRPESSVYFKGFGDSSIDFDMRVFIRGVEDRILVQNELRVAVFNAFKEEGIEIPFPQRDVNFKSTLDQNVSHELGQKPDNAVEDKKRSPKKT